MTRTLWMVILKNYNLNANEGFVIFLTMKPQSIAHLLNGNEHIYWILDLEGEVHFIWDLCVSGLKNARAMSFSKSGGRATVFGWVHKILIFWTCGCPCLIPTLRKVRGGGTLTSPWFCMCLEKHIAFVCTIWSCLLVVGVINKMKVVWDWYENMNL